MLSQNIPQFYKLEGRIRGNSLNFFGAEVARSSSGSLELNALNWIKLN